MRAASQALDLKGTAQTDSSGLDRLGGIECPDKLGPLLGVACRVAHFETADARPPQLTPPPANASLTVRLFSVVLRR
jgi:hypothetical protein